LADTQAAEQMAYNGAVFVKNTYSSQAIMHKLLAWLAE
jgi:hypothetical protein